MDNTLILEFMKNAPHKHIYDNCICKFCQLRDNECKHDKLNLVERGSGDGYIIYLCSCSKKWQTRCLHEGNYVDRHSFGSDYEDTYYCSKCGTHVDG